MWIEYWQILRQLASALVTGGTVGSELRRQNCLHFLCYHFNLLLVCIIMVIRSKFPFFFLMETPQPKNIQSLLSIFKFVRKVLTYNIRNNDGIFIYPVVVYNFFMCIILFLPTTRHESDTLKEKKYNYINNFY